jgi:beta-galactosidase
MKINLNQNLVFPIIFAGYLAVSTVRAEIEVHSFDVSTPPLQNLAAPDLAHWRATSPAGVTLSANKVHLLRDGKPMPVAAGEFHPQRYPVEYWEEAILEMKAGGLNVIGSYWFWTFIEPRPGKFDFTGNNDIRRFLALCQKHGMLAFTRIGPFYNAEILCGGLPPWIFGMPFVERSNDPAYLERVKLYYTALGEQMKGMMWQDGGPVHMVQVENELGGAANSWRMVFRYGAGEEHRGPKDPAEFTRHYERLRELSIGAGINPPFFAATGWGDAQEKLPKTNFVFGHGGYMNLARTGNANHPLTAMQPNPVFLDPPVPVAFIELGAAGSGARIGNVPQPPVENAECTALARLGSSRSLMIGWYMYHGGSDPLHPDYGFSPKSDNFPLISYDYHAPLSEYGLPRPAYYHVRPLHQTLLNFAATFAGGAVNFDTPVVRAAENRLRVSVRQGAADGGAIILLHYGNVKPLSDRQAAIELKTASGALRIPTTGSIDLKNGDFALLPFNVDLGHGVKLISATAQLCGRIENQNDDVIFCTSIRDQAAEFVLELPEGATLATSGRQEIRAGKTIAVITPTLDAGISVSLKNGQRLLLALLPKDAIRHSVEAEIRGQKTYLISDQDFVVDGNTVKFTSIQTNKFTLLAYPPVKWSGGQAAGVAGLFQRTTLQVPSREIHPEIKKVNPQKWLVKLPATEFENLNDIYAAVDFQGLVCRIFDQQSGLLVADQLGAKDLIWQVGLKRFRQTLAGPGIVFYANRDDGALARSVSADGMTLDETSETGKVAKLVSMTFLPEYQAALVTE